MFNSKGRDNGVIEWLGSKAVEVGSSSGGCCLVQTFSDEVYHRTNFTLGGRPSAVVATALALIKEALTR